MAYTPTQQTQYDQLIKAGASTDSANNAVLQIPGQSAAAPAVYNNPNPSPIPQVPQVPAAAAPVTPAPQPVTPAAPSPAPQPAAPTPAPTAATAQPGQPTMPANGSVVDLLNSAGQDSSFAARQTLAQQYGIQGYTGTAAQNTDLSKKFLDAFNAKKGSAVPQNSAEATSSLDDYFKDQSKSQTTQDPTKAFMDMYASMNPVEANLYQQLSTILSSQTTQQSLTDLYKQETASQGLPELNLELADMNKIMNGTEDDIRDEITNSGGFVTESQVQAMAGARNKNLLKQATYLSDVINAKNDYVDHIVSLTEADRKQVSDDLDRKLGITTTLANMADKMQNNAKENYQSIIDSVGWGGLAESLKGNPTQTAKVEKLFGLAPGELDALGTYKKPLTPTEELQFKNVELQNKKLQQDINAGPAASTDLQNFGTTDNPHYKLINSKTGATIADYGSSAPQVDKTRQLAGAQQTIQDTSELLQSPGLVSSVGVTGFGRTPVYSAAKSNFVAGVEQLREELTLSNLMKAKANGATFGALSDTEIDLLSKSSSKLGTWAVKNSAGNVVGYHTDEKDFKAELDKINRFAKLDYILAGGSPASVEVTEMPDGTLWGFNSDGSNVKIN